MKYYLDTEFIEDGKTIDLIFIGIVAEDGRELYLGNKNCKFFNASDWVIENVLLPMGFKKHEENGFLMRPIDAFFWKSKKAIAEEVFKFVGGEFNDDGSCKALTEKPEFWGWYCASDWVAFYQLFGTLLELPLGFPLRCNDLKQECDRLGNPSLPPKPVNKHIAIEDARWNKQVYEFLERLDFTERSKALRLG